MTIDRFRPQGHKSDMVRHGELLFISGIVAAHFDQPVEAQAEDILARLGQLLAEGGSSRAQVLSATIWLADIADRERVNTVWNRWVVPGHQPARTCIGADLAGSNVLIEIALTAAVAGPKPDGSDVAG
ncbi:RidA family protein [Sinirhodobacter populi]|uniref:RidA family protein n=1 Tax=Paenirhodobacter populi TaxID=2306993 RepID=A0A443K4H3_9RHOB|nr:RidA family protein [Sinirhodobacter populi]RWR27678.1 RidA family protein [Sinirhodobacter populi]